MLLLCTGNKIYKALYETYQGSVNLGSKLYKTCVILLNVQVQKEEYQWHRYRKRSGWLLCRRFFPCGQY